MKDTTSGIRVSDIRIGRAELRGVLIELTRELDVHDLEILRRTFEDTLSSRLPTYVDLSRVAFLDAACTRELAAQYRLYGRHGRLLALRDPTWQADASFRACGFGYLVGSYLDGEQFYPTEAWKEDEKEDGEALALAVWVLAMRDFGTDKEVMMSSVETLGRWLADYPRAGDEEPSVEATLLLDRKTNQELLYLSKRFNILKAELVQQLLRAAVRDVFKVIPSDPIPNELNPDLHDAGVHPEWFR